MKLTIRNTTDKGTSEQYFTFDITAGIPAGWERQN